jgi:hypothetical protein
MGGVFRPAFDADRDRRAIRRASVRAAKGGSMGLANS